MQEKQTFPAFKLLIPLLFMASFGSANACFPPLGTKVSSIAEKSVDSTYVFDGVITEIADSYIKVRVEQYFKGMGLKEIKIDHINGDNSCTVPYVLNQRALFFVEGNMSEPLRAVYDSAFGSSREMSIKNFNEVTTLNKCMATYKNGALIVPCIAHQDSKKVYYAELYNTTQTSGNLTLTVDIATPKTDIKSLAAVNEVTWAGTGAPNHPNTHYFSVKGMFSNGCGRLGAISTARTGADFTVTILQDPTGIVCTTALVPFEKKISLDLTGLAFLDYTINVNDAVTTAFKHKSDKPIIILD